MMDIEEENDSASNNQNSIKKGSMKEQDDKSNRFQIDVDLLDQDIIGDEISITQGNISPF